MSDRSNIEWTEATWNPVAGCTIVSPGCTNCYAMKLAERLALMNQPKYQGLARRLGCRPKWIGKIRIDEKALEIPSRWKQGRMIFVNSMSDLFHEDVTVIFIQRVFSVIEAYPRYTLQILTKRSERLRKISGELSWPANAWMGVSVENADYKQCIDDLRETGARVKFLSLEPLLGDLGELKLSGIHWAIAGGESGPGARPMDAEWVRSIRDQCVENGVAFHFKQWGGVNKKRTGRILDGRTWDEFPQAA